MRRFRLSLASISCFLLLPACFAIAASAVEAQTPAPSPSPTPTPKPPEIPDPLTDVEKAGKLTTAPEYNKSDLKPVAPLFNPRREALFTGPTSYRKPGRLKIGAFFPQEETLTNNTEDVFLSLGASVDLPARGATRPFTPELYLDASFHIEEDANEASLIGAGIGVRLYPGAKPGFSVAKLSRPRLFVGAGVGAYFLRYDINNVKQDAVKLGGKVTLGLDFVDDWSLEANYTFTGKLNDVGFGGPAVLLSYRF